MELKGVINKMGCQILPSAGDTLRFLLFWGHPVYFFLMKEATSEERNKLPTHELPNNRI